MVAPYAMTTTGPIIGDTNMLAIIVVVELLIKPRPARIEATNISVLQLKENAGFRKLRMDHSNTFDLFRRNLRKAVGPS
jgi:hypothetical protein